MEVVVAEELVVEVEDWCVRGAGDGDCGYSIIVLGGWLRECGRSDGVCGDWDWDRIDEVGMDWSVGG